MAEVGAGEGQHADFCLPSFILAQVQPPLVAFAQEPTKEDLNLFRTSSGLSAHGLLKGVH